MSQYPVENIRTVALVGHGSTGKTTLLESLLYRNGVIKEVGTVEKGNTVGDFDPMEKEVKHSLRTTVAHLNERRFASSCLTLRGIRIASVKLWVLWTPLRLFVLLSMPPRVLN